MMFAEINPDLILLFILCCQFQVSSAAKGLPAPIRYPQLLLHPARTFAWAFSNAVHKWMVEQVRVPRHIAG